MIMILRRKHFVHRFISIAKVEQLFCSPGDNLVRKLYDIIISFGGVFSAEEMGP